MVRFAISRHQIEGPLLLEPLHISKNYDPAIREKVGCAGLEVADKRLRRMTDAEVHGVAGPASSKP